MRVNPREPQRRSLLDSMFGGIHPASFALYRDMAS
jgi:hypothetical protein